MSNIPRFAFTGDNPYKVDGEQIKQRAKVLQKYLKDEQKELQALYALQALMVQMEQPASKWLSETFQMSQMFLWIISVYYSTA